MTDERIVKDAVYIIDDRGMRSRQDPQSGWDYDDRGAVNPKRDLRGLILCTDKETPYGVTMKREFLPLKNGKAGFTASFTLYDGDGFFVRFFGKDGKIALDITQKDGMFFCGGVMMPYGADYKSHYLTINFNIDAKTAEVIFSGRLVGTYPLTNDSLARVKFGYGKTDEGTAVLNNVKMYINYLVCETCSDLDDGDLPYGWRTEVCGQGKSGRSNYYEGMNLHTYVLTAAPKSTVKAIHDFDKTSGNICFEVKYLAKTDDENIKLSLCCGSVKGITITDNGKMSQTSGGKVLRSHSVYVWQTLRIEADTATGKAFIKHNGKKCGEVDFDNKCDCFDRIEIEYASKNGGILKFVDAYVFVIQPEPFDYVPAPVMPKKKDYYVGMNICSLWRNGDHWGWDVISPYDENKTYMGYYDEGLPEVADWEIKWMLEHGLDFELYCWYNNQTNAPICKTALSAAIHGGHFNAKYGDDMKFAIIWEAANCAHPSPEAFEKYMVPYWVDYFFTDPRYMTIENKLVISIFGISRLMKDFGSADGVKKEFDYLRKVAKSLGFDGVLFMSCSGPTPEVIETGSDAIYAYNWGKQGYDGDYTKSQIQGQLDKHLIHVIPTVSVGFNNVAWAGTRSPMMTNQTMGDVLEWFKKDVLPKNEGEDWKRKFVMFSTWNEYGEGTYICPSEGNGFGYLDEMRKAFTDEKTEHTDIRPNEHQLERLGYLYPKGRSLLRAFHLAAPMLPDTVVENIPLTKENVSSWNSYNGLEIKVDNGVLKGEGTLFDPQFIFGTSIDTSKITGIRVKMKTAGIDKSLEESKSRGEGSRIFFTTDTDANYSESKGKSPYVSDDGYAYYLMDSLPAWTGTVTSLRFDPTDAAGKFEIESIDLVVNSNKYFMEINGNQYDSTVSPVVDGNTYIPFEPQRGFCTLTKTYHEWDKETQTLTLYADDKTVIITKGKDEIYVCGKAVKLAKNMEFEDGLPMLPMKELCKVLGWKCEIDGKNISITTK